MEIITIRYLMPWFFDRAPKIDTTRNHSTNPTISQLSSKALDERDALIDTDASPRHQTKYFICHCAFLLKEIYSDAFDFEAYMLTLFHCSTKEEAMISTVNSLVESNVPSSQIKSLFKQLGEPIPDAAYLDYNWHSLIPGKESLLGHLQSHIKAITSNWFLWTTQNGLTVLAFYLTLTQLISFAEATSPLISVPKGATLQLFQADRTLTPYMEKGTCVQPLVQGNCKLNMDPVQGTSLIATVPAKEKILISINCLNSALKLGHECTHLSLVKTPLTPTSEVLAVSTSGFITPDSTHGGRCLTPLGAFVKTCRGLIMDTFQSRDSRIKPLCQFKATCLSSDSHNWVKQTFYWAKDRIWPVTLNNEDGLLTVAPEQNNATTPCTSKPLEAGCTLQATPYVPRDSELRTVSFCRYQAQGCPDWPQEPIIEPGTGRGTYELEDVSGVTLDN